MSDHHLRDFDDRFQHVVSRMRFTRVMTVLGWTALALTLAFVTLACLDYVIETKWTFRAVTLGVAILGSLCAATTLVLQALKRWDRKATAAQVERRFEDLGQSVRTTIQYHDDAEEKTGASPRLLNALHHDIYGRTEELRLTEAVSTSSLRLSVALLGILGVIALAACVASWDWRMAVFRSFLGDAPYTTIKVKQSVTRVDEKATFTMIADIAGRVDRDVRLLTRDMDGERNDWAERSLTTKDEVSSATRLVSYQVDIPKVRTPFEYQVVAGQYASLIHQVNVRYPLAISAIRIEVEHPEYTGIGTKVVDKGSFETVEGSHVTVGIQLDHAPRKAWLELHPIVTPRGEQPRVETVPVKIEGVQLTAELDPREDRFYQVFAESSDGTTLRPNRYRIRVHRDRPPKVAFQKPDQLIEVNPLAELLMRLRVADDYGLRRAGIVLQLNNDPEIIVEDIAYADMETGDGKLAPQTRAIIESRLPLEYFEMTVKDSISYYAFAEDNRPARANVNETDLQFIDVRPFRRNYPVPEEGQGLRGAGNDNPNARNLPELNEMIGRERFVLNRTMQMKRQHDRGHKIDVGAIDNLVNVQNETSEFAGLMGDEASSIEQRFGIPEEGRISDLLYQAQRSMLASVDSLATSEFEVAKLQERDALRYLIDARQRLDDPTAGGTNNGGGAAFRAAFRRLLRRMRQPKNDQERANEIVRRLRRAAAEQQFLMERMSDLVPPIMSDAERPEPEGEVTGNSAEPDPKSEMPDAEDKPSLAELRRGLEHEQADLVEDVRDIIDLIEELAQISELAQQRTIHAADQIGGVIGAMERGDTDKAIEYAEAATSAFRVLADNIAGITANEATKRIEIARDLGLLLTDDIRILSDKLSTVQQEMAQSRLSPSKATERELELASPLSRSAREQAEVAKTLADILNSIVDPEQGIQDSEDRIVKRLQEIMVEHMLDENVRRMQQLPTAIDSLDWTNTGVQASDLAERFDILSQRLDAMHREIVSPRIEQLRKLERRAVESRQGLSGLRIDDQISRWHRRADGLLQDIESAQVAEREVELMREAMEDAGWAATGKNTWNWNTNTSLTALEPPEEYVEALTAVIRAIQRQIREHSMVRMEITNGGAIPPKYKNFVERYFELMSGATSDSDVGDVDESKTD